MNNTRHDKLYIQCRCDDIGLSVNDNWFSWYGLFKTQYWKVYQEQTTHNNLRSVPEKHII